MRRSILMLAMVVMMMLTALPAASARVHAITPLLQLGCTGVQFGTTGANGTNGTPADVGGPLVEGMGPIPNSTGSANLPTMGANTAFTAPVEAC